MARYNGRRVLQVLRFGSIIYVNGQPVAIFDADTKLDKQTGVTTYAKVYLKNTDGTQGVANATHQIVSGAVVLRNAAGAILVPLTPFDQYSAIPKGYADDTYLAKGTETTAYPQAYIKWTNGTNGKESVTDERIANAIVRRDANGQISVPDIPDNSKRATSKKYVDSNFSGVYKHDVTILLDMAGTGNEFYKIRGHVFNNSSTALTTLSEVFADLICEYGGDKGGNGYAVQKIPNGFAHDEFTHPRAAFIFTSSAGVVTYIDPSDTSVISDVSVSDVAAKL